jgi:hypothetical protein
MENDIQANQNASDASQTPVSAEQSYETPTILPETLPQPTYWPLVMGFGITFIFWGITSNYAISGVGLVLFAIALAGWIGDIRHES